MVHSYTRASSYDGIVKQQQRETEHHDMPKGKRLCNKRGHAADRLSNQFEKS